MVVSNQVTRETLHNLVSWFLGFLVSWFLGLVSHDKPRLLLEFFWISSLVFSVFIFAELKIEDFYHLSIHKYGCRSNLITLRWMNEHCDKATHHFLFFGSVVNECKCPHLKANEYVVLLVSCHLASCHTCACHTIVSTNFVAICTSHVQNSS